MAGSRVPLSLEAQIELERKEVMELLEGRQHQPSNQQPPRINRTASPAPVIRSMLDLDAPVPPRHGSIAGIGVGVTTPSPLHYAHSMTDGYANVTTSSPTGSSGQSPSSPTSPPEMHRSPLVAEGWSVGKTGNIQEDYKFSMLSAGPSSVPKRVTQGGKKEKPLPSSIAAAMTGDYSSLSLQAPQNQRIIREQRRSASRSPSRFSRSRSPTPTSYLNNNSYNPMRTPGVYVSDSGKTIRMENAYRRLSDAALLKSGGSLAELASKKHSRAQSAGNASPSPDTNTRLLEDDLEGGEDAAVESDEDNADEDSSGDDTEKPEGSRGRRRTRRPTAPTDKAWADKVDGLKKTRSKGSQPAKSLLAAAEEERKPPKPERCLSISSKYKVRSLLEPALTVTGPGGEKTLNRRSGVHPLTNFDYSASPMSTPGNSDNEADLPDIRRAQKMSIHLSDVHTEVPNRAIRTIIRGDYKKMQDEAEEGKRKKRSYFIATDLSEEAKYALEWGVGTFLRDGDDVLAVYAIDEETGIGKTPADSEDSLGEGARVMQETAKVIGSLTAATSTDGPGNAPSPGGSSSFLSGYRSHSTKGSSDSRGLNKFHQERLRAIEEITDRCVKYLRKTTLQVRISIEVIHCKNPKHLILEAIDAMSPTLVIIGSRGQGTVKGVLLGSFSNYLVTKSSVPVMVARKKLRKHAKATNIRLSNNLTKPRRLSWAKVD
ncbi:MAG: hypothetical protein M1834_003102 [Cirrosporium novae-zelandiae]|nr:MAG: hypothetical protein M1834_003102 [Cirrosporium novae-zelandiae]